MIAFLHTSPTHILRFTKIVRKYNSTIEIEHFVDEKLLKTALATGKVDKTGFIKAVQHIRDKQPKLIICTCSTYGEACDEFTDIKRIDMPIVKYIVRHFSTIILAYTAASTRNVSKQLLENVSNTRGKELEIINCDCTTAWEYFLSNDMEKYYKEIFKKVNAIHNKGYAVFLAQASMEGAIKYFEGSNVEVFSSGEFGVRKYMEEM